MPYIWWPVSEAEKVHNACCTCDAVNRGKGKKFQKYFCYEAKWFPFFAFVSYELQGRAEFISIENINNQSAAS